MTIDVTIHGSKRITDYGGTVYLPTRSYSYLSGSAQRTLLGLDNALAYGRATPGAFLGRRTEAPCTT